MVRAEDVGAAQYNGVDATGPGASGDEMIRGGFAYGLSVGGLQRAGFGATGAGGRAAVDLVGADVDDFRDLKFAGDFQKAVGAENIGAEKRSGILDAAIDVSFRGEIDCGIETLAGNASEGLRVCDVSFDELVVRIIGRFLEILRVAGVS